MKHIVYRCTASAPHPNAGQFVTEEFAKAHPDICAEDTIERDTQDSLDIATVQHILKGFGRNMKAADARKMVDICKRHLDSYVAELQILEEGQVEMPRSGKGQKK